jgi:hypothetical protein
MPVDTVREIRSTPPTVDGSSPHSALAPEDHDTEYYGGKGNALTAEITDDIPGTKDPKPDSSREDTPVETKVERSEDDPIMREHEPADEQTGQETGRPNEDECRSKVRAEVAEAAGAAVIDKAIQEKQSRVEQSDADHERIPDDESSAGAEANAPAFGEVALDGVERAGTDDTHAEPSPAHDRQIPPESSDPPSRDAGGARGGDGNGHDDPPPADGHDDAGDEPPDDSETAGSERDEAAEEGSETGVSDAPEPPPNDLEERREADDSDSQRPLSTNGVAERLGISQIKAVRALRNGSLLGFRVLPDQGKAQVYRCPQPYLAAVERYQETEGIEAPTDALQEFATDEPYVAWGVRALHQDELRAHGEYLSLDEAAKLLSTDSRWFRAVGLSERIVGRRDWVVNTEKLIQQEEWAHRTFEQEDKILPPVEFCNPREAADMLGVTASAIHGLVSDGLLPAWQLNAPFRHGNDRERTLKQNHIPIQDVQALKDFYADHTAYLKVTARSFLDAHPYQYLRTRGQFEARTAALENAGELKTVRAVGQMLGVGKNFFKHYQPMNAWQSLAAIRWAPIKQPDLSKEQYIDPRKIQQVLREVIVNKRSYSDVAAEHGVSNQSISNWVVKANRGEMKY